MVKRIAKPLAFLVSILYQSVKQIEMIQMKNMLRGFIRTAETGPNRKSQERALNEVGITDFSEYGPVYVDDRNAAIQSLAEGDILVVSEPSRLGVSMPDIVGALKSIGEHGASVMRADTKETVSWSPDTQKVIEFAVEADSTNRKIIAANARRALDKSGKPRGLPAVQWDTKKLAMLKQMDESGGFTRQQIADKLKVSRATLQRKLAELNTKKGAK